MTCDSIDIMPNNIYYRGTLISDSKYAFMTNNVESNGRFHSDWLSMIYTRLKLARNLLTDDGVIFISIDENEFLCVVLIGGKLK